MTTRPTTLLFPAKKELSDNESCAFVLLLGHLLGSERSWKVYSVRGTNAFHLFDEAIDRFSDGVGVRAWKRTRPGIW